MAHVRRPEAKVTAQQEQQCQGYGASVWLRPSRTLSVICTEKDQRTMKANYSTEIFELSPNLIGIKIFIYYQVF